MKRSGRIWRYLDLAKFIGLLARGIHFARPHALGDDWEGTWGVMNIRSFREEYFGRPEAGATEWKARVAEKRKQLDGVGVSCWHRSEHESAALWALYMPRGLGVAVRTNVERLTSAFEEIDRPVELIDVTYSDFDGEKLPSEPSVLLRHKRLEFHHEKEVRFLLRFSEDELKVIDQLDHVLSERDRRWISLSPINGGLIRPGPSVSVRDSSVLGRATRVGVHLPVSTASIIERVHLAPKVSEPVRHAVIDLIERFGLDRSIVVSSNQDMIPPDRLDFFP